MLLIEPFQGEYMDKPAPTGHYQYSGATPGKRKPALKGRYHNHEPAPYDTRRAPDPTRALKGQYQSHRATPCVFDNSPRNAFCRIDFFNSSKSVNFC